MMRTHLGRGALAGLLAGVLAVLIGFAVGQPLLEAALVVEEQLHHADEHVQGISRLVQQVGMAIGLVVAGVVLGLVFGAVTAWATGRVQGGDPWDRSLRLGGALLVAVVALPLLAYPPSPPGAVERVPGRAFAYVLVVVIGCALVAVLRVVSRTLASRGVSRPIQQLLTGALAVAVAVIMLAFRPDLAPVIPEFPGELLWRFRLASVAVQVVLVGGTAVAYGLLASHAERRAAAGVGMRVG